MYMNKTDDAKGDLSVNVATVAIIAIEVIT